MNTFLVKLIGQKVYYMTHQCPQCHQDEQRGVGEVGKKEKQSDFLLLFFFCSCFVCFLACLLCFVFLGRGGTAVVRGGYGGTRG